MNTYAWDRAFALVCLLILLACLIGLIAQNVRARRAARNARQVEDHIRMTHGFYEARRRGWLPEDLQ